MFNLLDEFDKYSACSHAFLTTFEFNPGFFEDRVLKTSLLRSCPSITILIDESKYQDICKDPSGGKQINRRYMLIPVKMPKPNFSVFHPKLWLFVGKDNARLFVGSANLTRPGITSNLEMISSFEANGDSNPNEIISLFKTSLAFIKNIINSHCFHSDSLIQSFKQMSMMTPMFSENHSDGGDIRIIHNLENPILDQFLDNPSFASGKIKIISPYFDGNIGEIIDLISQKLAIKKIDIYIQQNTNTLNVDSLKKWLDKSKSIPIQIYAIGIVGRKLHAKLLFIESKEKRMALIGSANFTKSALIQTSSKGNIELCLAINGTAAEAVNKALGEDFFVYDKIDLNDVISLPKQKDPPSLNSSIQLYHAEYYPDLAIIRAHYKCEPVILTAESSVKMLIKKIDSEYPDSVADLSNRDKDKDVFEFKVDSHTASLFSQSVNVAVIVTSHQKEYTSNHVWLLNVVDIKTSIDNNNSKIIRQLRESGKGLVDFINNYIEQGMIDKAISLLESLTIKFDSGGRTIINRPILRTPNSPITDDDIPLDIWKMSFSQRQKMSRAISEFIIRHHQNVLKKHLRNPNLNGIENFLDVMETCANIEISAVQNRVMDRHDVYPHLLSGFEMFVGNNLEEGFFRGLWCEYYSIKDKLKKALFEKKTMERIIAYSLALVNMKPNRDKNGPDIVTIEHVYQLSSKEYIKHFFEFMGTNYIDQPTIDNIIKHAYNDNRVLKTRFTK